MASMNRRKPSAELDQYAPTMTQELLEGLNDWKHVPDIIRLTFKALSDVVQTQGAAIHDLERQVLSKASKSEVAAGLSAKASMSDVTQAVAEVAGRKTQTEVVESLITEKVSKTELQSILRSSITEKDVRSLLEQKVSTRVFETELKALQEVLEDMQRTHLSQLQRLDTELKDLCQVLDQKADQSELDKISQGKANRQSVISALQTKVSKEELDTVLRSRASAEAVEHCTAEVKTLKGTVESLIDHTNAEMQELRAEMGDRVQAAERLLTALRSEVSALFSNSEQDAKRINLLVARMDEKADTEKVTSVLTSFKVDIADIAAALKKEQTVLDDRFSAQFRDLGKALDKLSMSMDGRLKQAQEGAISMNTDLAGKFEELERRVLGVYSGDAKSLHTDVLALVEDLNKRKAEAKDLGDVRRVVAEALNNTKQDFEKYKESLFEHLNRTQADLTRYVETIIARPPHPDLLLVQKDLASCVRSKDLQPLLDLKSNIDDFAHNLFDIHKEVESRLTVSEFRTVYNDLKATTDLLLLENCTARWLWTSGTIKSDRRIPWEAQAINTRPDNFIWEEGQFAVYTVIPGLYEVSLGVFARVRPRVQLFVNDQSVYRLGFADVDTGKQWGPHIDGNLIGQTLRDVVALPTRARLYVTYEGEWRAEAFLSLRKL